MNRQGVFQCAGWHFPFSIYLKLPLLYTILLISNLYKGEHKTIIVLWTHFNNHRDGGREEERKGRKRDQGRGERAREGERSERERGRERERKTRH